MTRGMLFRVPGPDCSKLTTSLVNVSLNFQKLISQICQYPIKCTRELNFMTRGMLFRVPGPDCSKLTTSLVNVSLNFQKLISQICQYFC